MRLRPGRNTPIMTIKELEEERRRLQEDQGLTPVEIAHKRTEEALKRLEKVSADYGRKLMTPEKADRIQAYLNTLGAEEKRKRLSICIDYVSKNAAADAIIDRLDFWSFLTPKEIDMLFPESAGNEP